MMLQIHNLHAIVGDKRSLFRGFAPSREPTISFLTRSREAAKKVISLEGSVG